MAKLERKHVESALDEIGDPGNVPPRYRAAKYCLITRGKHWSPKYVVGLAWKYAAGKAKRSSEHSGGIHGANAVLGAMEYTVERCPAARRH